MVAKIDKKNLPDSPQWHPPKPTGTIFNEDKREGELESFTGEAELESEVDNYTPNTPRTTTRDRPSTGDILGDLAGHIPGIPRSAAKKIGEKMNDQENALENSLGEDRRPPPKPTEDTTTTTTGDTPPTDQELDAEKEADRVARLDAARKTNQEIAEGAVDYLAKNDLTNEYTSEDIYLRNEDGTVKVDPETKEPLVRPEFTQEQREMAPIVAPVTQGATASEGVASFADASAAQAYLASVSEATNLTAADHANIQAAQDVIVKDYEASLIPLSEVGNSIEKIRNERPMEAASVAQKLNGLLAGMENGDVPMWARPAVTKVEQSLAARGIGASSVGRDSLFNAIIQSAMPIAQADANFEQDANKTGYQARVNAIMSDSAQEFAARQFNASSINQRNQFISGLQAQVDQQNAARKDSMSQFNASEKNRINQFNVQQTNETSRFNVSEANRVELANAQQQSATSLANAQLETQVSMANADAATRTSLANAQQKTQVSISNAQMANDMAKFTVGLEAQRDQFNTQQANLIAQADVNWRRSLNTAETAGINAANQANVANAFNLTNQAQQNIWQESRDYAHWAETANENMIARKHEGAMRILLASEASAAAEAQADAGKTSIWDSAKEQLVQRGIDSAIDWLTGD